MRKAKLTGYLSLAKLNWDSHQDRLEKALSMEEFQKKIF